jgi:parallel beta-helix repeat protein
MKKNMLSKAFVVGVIVLFIGACVIPTTTSFALKAKFNSMEKNVTYKTSQYNQRDIDNNEHLTYDPAREFDNRFLLEENIRQYPREFFDYKETDSIHQNIKLTNMFNNEDYSPHDPIVINGDEGFTEENGVTGGSGTEEDPYIIEGWEINGGEYGIRIYHTTSYFIVRNCRLTGGIALDFDDIEYGAISTVIADGNVAGIYATSSSNITIQDSIFSSNDYFTMYLWGTSFCTLSNITASDGSSGIFVRESSNILIEDCDVYNNDFGIDLYKSINIILRDNNMYSNKYNLEIHGSNPGHFYHDIDTSNMVDGKLVYYFFNESGLVLSGIEDIGFLGLIKCTSISVEGLTIDISNRHGILLVETTDSTIASSTISNSAWGIYLFKSSSNTIIDCKTSGAKTTYGIEIFHGSSNNNILDCEVKGGILIEKAPDNKLRNNIITGNYLNFQVFGNKIPHFFQDIDTSSTINGKPIFYYIEEDNLDISGDDIGYLGFVNCSNVNVHDVTIQYVGSGILLVNTDGVVENCELKYCSWGIHLFMSSDVDIIKCNFKNNFCGVYLHYSSFNQVLKCDLSSNRWHGCLLENSDNNTINRCDVYFTGMDAFFIEDSYDNEMHYNNIAYSSQSGLIAKYSSVDATYNWWGHASGPGGMGPGNGDRILFAYEIIGTISIIRKIIGFI